MGMARAKTKANPFEQYRLTLEAKQQELLDSYERDMAAGNEQPDDGIQDLADKAASAYSKELNFSLSDAERETLVLIEEALKRINDNTYGNCFNCGQVIGEMYLELADKMPRIRQSPWAPDIHTAFQNLVLTPVLQDQADIDAAFEELSAEIERIKAL